MNNLPAVQDFEVMQRVSLALYKSGYFSDVKSEAQAIVKVMAGAEMGIKPFASMSGIDIINGKPTPSANLTASLVKNDPRYDYRIEQATDKECALIWYENGDKVGMSSFTIEEANRASLTGKAVWKQYPSDMLFARALTRGARRFAPGIFGGAPVYTPEELGVDVDESGDVFEGELLTVSTPPEPVLQVDDVNEMLGLGEPDPPVEKAEPATEIAKEPLFNGNVTDARSWLEEKVQNGIVELGLVGDALGMTGLYNNWMHFKNALTPNEETGNKGYDFPEGFKVIRAQKVTGAGSMKIFDWAVERKRTETNDVA